MRNINFDVSSKIPRFSFIIFIYIQSRVIDDVITPKEMFSYCNFNLHSSDHCLKCWVWGDVGGKLDGQGIFSYFYIFQRFHFIEQNIKVSAKLNDGKILIYMYLFYTTLIIIIKFLDASPMHPQHVSRMYRQCGINIAYQIRLRRVINKFVD